jgi:hypothetical protein
MSSSPNGPSEDESLRFSFPGSHEVEQLVVTVSHLKLAIFIAPDCSDVLWDALCPQRESMPSHILQTDIAASAQKEEVPAASDAAVTPAEPSSVPSRSAAKQRELFPSAFFTRAYLPETEELASRGIFPTACLSAPIHPLNLLDMHSIFAPSTVSTLLTARKNTDQYEIGVYLYFICSLFSTRFMRPPTTRFEEAGPPLLPHPGCTPLSLPLAPLSPRYDHPRW